MHPVGLERTTILTLHPIIMVEGIANWVIAHWKPWVDVYTMAIKNAHSFAIYLTEAI